MVSFPAHRIPRFRQRNAWNALADIEVFIFAVDAECIGVHRRGRKPDPELRRLLWCTEAGERSAASEAELEAMLC